MYPGLTDIDMQVLKFDQERMMSGLAMRRHYDDATPEHAVTEDWKAPHAFRWAPLRHVFNFFRRGAHPLQTAGR